MGRDPAEAPLSSQSYVGQYIVTVQLKKVLIVLKIGLILFLYNIQF